MNGMLGKKIGMTQVFDEIGNMVPVTVLQVGPCYVTQVKTVESDGYNAVQIGFEEKKEKNTTQPLMGHFNKAGVPALRYVKEFRQDLPPENTAGDVINVDMFEPGQIVKVTGTSKGKGFTGVVKRHGFGGSRASHGQSYVLRAPGSIGQSSNPSKVFKGMKMAGRTGGDRVTHKQLEVVRVESEKNLLFIKGAVPGSRDSLVEIYK